MAFDWYNSTDTALAGTAYTLSTSAGTPSSAIELHAWLNKGSSVGSPETRHLRVYVESAGTYHTSGLDTLDRREFEIRIIGSQNPDLVPEFSAPATAWTAVGTDKTFQFPAIYPNCCIEIEVRINPLFAGGSSSPVTFRIKAVLGAAAVPVSIPNDVTVDGNLDFGANVLSNVHLGATTVLDAALDANAQAITDLALANPDQAGNAASVKFVVSRPSKSYARLCATAAVTWPNVISNGTFATVLTPWSGTNWAQSAGTALHTAGSTAPLVQSVTIVDAVIYRITVTVSGAAGTVTPSIGADVGTPIAAGAGAVSQEILSTAGGTLNVGFAPSSDFDGALDDILVETVLYGLPDNIDSVAVANGNRVLLTAEAVDTRHGKWMVSTTDWARHPDCLEAYALYPGSGMYVSEGTANGRAYWVQTAAVADIETDPQTWEKAWAL